MKHLVLLLLPFFAFPAWGASTYVLDTGASSVGFTAQAQGFSVTGTLPVSVGAGMVDLGNIAATEIDVTVATKTVRTGFAPATAAIKSADLLDAESHPDIRFQVARIERTGNTAQVSGDLTVKSITRPVTFTARFVRTEETDPDDLERIGVQLTGTVDRRDFNILGYPSLVANEITIDVVAWLDRVER